MIPEKHELEKYIEQLKPQYEIAKLYNVCQMTVSKWFKEYDLKSKIKIGGSKQKYNLIGMRFGRLLVQYQLDERDNNGNILWYCKCDCGNEVKVNTSELRRGKALSCGCIKKEKLRKAKTKYEIKDNRIYSIWRTMRHRCNNDKNEHYGGRGIKICDEWLGTEGLINFYNWAMANGYQDDLTIDRINNNGNYEPDNCRWTTMKVQNNNKRTNIIITYMNETHTLIEWSRILNINYKSLSAKHKAGKSIEELFKTNEYAGDKSYGTEQTINCAK